MSDMLDYDYENETPMNDPDEVLCLMVVPWGSQKEICIRRQKHVEPHVEIQSYYCNHAHAVLDGVERFRVTPAVIEKLLADGLVRGIPRMGYTDMNTLALTAQGEEVGWEKRQARTEKFRGEILAMLPELPIRETERELVWTALKNDRRMAFVEHMHKRLKQLRELNAGAAEFRKALGL